MTVASAPRPTNNILSQGGDLTILPKKNYTTKQSYYLNNYIILFYLTLLREMLSYQGYKLFVVRGVLTETTTSVSQMKIFSFRYRSFCDFYGFIRLQCGVIF